MARAPGQSIVVFALVVTGCGDDGTPSAGPETGSTTAPATSSTDGGTPAVSTTGETADTSGGPSGIELSCLDLPVGAVLAEYEQPLVETDAASLEATGLPGGLELATDGTLAGIPTEAGRFAIEVLATDDDGTTASATCSIVIQEALALDPTIDPFGGDYCVTQGQSLLDRIVPGTGDETPIECSFQFAALGGHLPAGLSVDPDTCEILGTVVEPRFGAFAFIVEAEQSGHTLYVPHCASQPVANFDYTIEVSHSGIADAALLPIVREFAEGSPLGFYTLGDPRIRVTSPGTCSPAACYSSYHPIAAPGGFDLETLELVNFAQVFDMAGTAIGIEHDILMTGPVLPEDFQRRPWVYQMSMGYCLGAAQAECNPGDPAGQVDLAIVMVPG